MYSEALIKARLVRLLNEGKLGEVVTEFNPIAASTSYSSTSVEALLQENFPQELFIIDIGNSTRVRVPIPGHFNDLLFEIIEANVAINNKAAALGWVGNPTSDFTVSRGGYLRHFENASIYWTALYRAKEVHGAIRDRYFQMGAQLSYLGFPQTDELSVTQGGVEVRYSNFQGGTILWTMDRGPFLIPSFSPTTERHTLGAWLYMIGQGFTPNNRVTFWIINAPNPPKNIGSIYTESDGRFGSYPERTLVVDLRNLPGDREPSIARAVDEATGQISDYQLSYALF